MRRKGLLDIGISVRNLMIGFLFLKNILMKNILELNIRWKK